MIIVLGEGMKRTLVEEKCVPPGKVRVIPTWGRPELNPIPKDQAEPIRKELGISPGEILLLYAGNMGLMHPLDPILDAAVELRDLPIHFLFVGDGVRREHLLKRIQEEKLSQVIHLPFQPEERFVRLVAAADACLVTLEVGFERLAVPSRAYTFLSAGRSLITIMAPEADLAQLVTKTGCGWNVLTGHELARLLRELIFTPEEFTHRGQKARKVYEERFQREVIIEEYAKVLGG